MTYLSDQREADRRLQAEWDRTDRAHAAWPLPTAPWSHQLDAFGLARDRQAFLLAHDMGCGKSATTIALLDHWQARRVLVLCPRSVVSVWGDQLAQHSTRPWHVWAGQVTGQRGKPLANPSVPRRAEALVQATALATAKHAPLMAVVNYEAACQGAMGQLLLGTDWDAVVLDESHRLKTPSGKQSRYAAKVTHKTRANGGRILALTGTPMPHTALDLWAQLRALDGGHRLGQSYRNFCQLYAEAETFWAPGGVQRVRYTGIRAARLAEFREQVADVMHHVAAVDVLDLPETTDTWRACDLGPGARRVYEALEKDMIAQLTSTDCLACGGSGAIDTPDGTRYDECDACRGTGRLEPEEGDGDAPVVTAANAMVLVTRLAQAASGFGKTHGDGEVVSLDDGPPAKARLLADVLDDVPADQPVVVFCRFHHDLDQVKAVAAKTSRTYGELSGRERSGLDGPRLRDGVTLLGAQLKSGGVGIDLTAASVAVYYSLDFALGDYVQSRARVHRPGQDRHVTYIHLVASGTVDHALDKALRGRAETVDAVISYLKDRQ